MSSVGNAFQSEAKRSYLTARVFNNDFYSYNQTVNPTTFKVSFALGAVVGATSVNCPDRRFLHETGRKLIPGANGGVNTLMVGVYDPVSGLSGFIDPNSEAFTTMNTDKSANIETIVNGTNSLSVFGLNPNSSTSDLADPVYTRGDVIALGEAVITGDITSLTGDVTADQGDVVAELGDVRADAGDVVAIIGDVRADAGDVVATLGDLLAPAGNVVAAKQVYSSTVTTLVIASNITNIDPSLGQTFFVASNSNFRIDATGITNALAGAIVRVIISNPNDSGSQITVVLGNNIRELYNGTGISTNLVANVGLIPVTVNTTVVATTWTGTGSTNAGATATVTFATSSARSFEIPENVTGVITFLCDGTNMLEMSRCLVNGV